MPIFIFLENARKRGENSSTFEHGICKAENSNSCAGLKLKGQPLQDWKARHPCRLHLLPGLQAKRLKDVRVEYQHTCQLLHPSKCFEAWGQQPKTMTDYDRHCQVQEDKRSQVEALCLAHPVILICVFTLMNVLVIQDNQISERSLKSKQRSTLNQIVS